MNLTLHPDPHLERKSAQGSGLRRCGKRVYLGLSDLGESGFEQRGPLLKAVWKMQMQEKGNSSL
ncbi:MAG: hypothetical protein FD146_2397 [Anaerolineaceae bacterium]|nr:MAG: hypothetical protein FD146_2397 [Anaerolineaceae bacterium]